MRRLLLLLLCLAGAAQAEDLTGYAFQQRPGAALPMDAPLRDEAGQTVTLRGVAGGRPLLLALGYLHCPNLCGVLRDDTLAALSRAGRRAGRDYDVAFVTIDPAETAADAAASRSAGLVDYPLDPGGRHYLTGPPDSLHAIQDAVGLRARYDTALRQFLHPAGLVTVTGAGIVSGYVLGVGYTPEALDAAIDRARAGVAARADPILLLCFHFDETTGRYSADVLKMVRLASLVTVAGLAVVLLRGRRSRTA